MKTRSWITLLGGLVAGTLVWAADEGPQENERQILGAWQAGQAVVEFLPDGKARIVERGVAKEGAYEINGDWLFVRVDGEDEKSGLLLIEGDHMTVDEHEFRRVRPFDAAGLIGKWTSERADIDLRADGGVTVFEKSTDKGKSGRFEIEGNAIRLNGDAGDTELKPFEIEGDTLVIDGVQRLVRIGGEYDPRLPVVGEWRHEKGTVVKVTSDGRFEMTAGQAREGTYTVQGSVLTVRTDDDTERAFAASLEDGDLVLDGELRLTRVDAGPAGDPVGSTAGKRHSVFAASGAPPQRFEAAIDAFLEARKNLFMMAAEGLGARHPSSLRAISEARFLLKRCHEEADLLDAPAEAREGIFKRLHYYGDAFEREIVDWGSR